MRVLALALLLLVFPAAARGATCPGADPCPYGAYASFSQNGGGVFRQPQAVAVAPSGDVYVADRWSYVVQRFDSGGAFLGEFGEYGSGPGQFGAIGGIAIDSSGNVYVLDADHNRVEKFSSSGAFIRQFGSSVLNIGWKGGIAVAGSTVYVSNSDQEQIARFGLDGTPKAAFGDSGVPDGFSHPLGLAVSGGHLFVADDRNDRVVELDATTGAYQAQAGGVTNAYDVGVDGSGNVWVADNGGNRVVRYDSSLANPTPFAGAGFNTPRALAISPAGNVYVADTLNERVQELDPAGNVLAVFGVNGRSGGNLTGPQGLALAPDGHLVIADTLEYAMQELDPGGAFIRRWGNHVIFQLQSDVAVDGAGNMYVADTGHDEVQKWDPTLGAHSVIGLGQLAAPEGVAVDAVGNIFVADSGNDRVAKFDSAGNLVASFTGFDEPSDVEVSGALVYVSETGANRVDELTGGGTRLASFGSHGSGAGQLDQPEGLGIDPQGNVYVADSGNSRVERFGPSGAFLDSWGLYGHGPGEFVAPSDITVAGSGDAYVSDTFNNRLERFSFGAGSPPPPPAAIPAPKPRLAAPRLRLRVARRQRVLRQHGVKLSLSCASTCRVVVTATVSAPGAARPLRLRTLTVTLHAKHVAHRTLALTRPARRRIASSLRRHQHVSVLLAAIARAPAGPSATSKRRARVEVTG